MPRYIDADALLRNTIYNPSHVPYITESDIIFAPTADVEPVKHGKWIYDCERTMQDGWTYRQYHCSVCEFQMIGGIHNYCPNCGARMYGENDG